MPNGRRKTVNDTIKAFLGKTASREIYTKSISSRTVRHKNIMIEWQEHIAYKH